MLIDVHWQNYLRRWCMSTAFLLLQSGARPAIGGFKGEPQDAPSGVNQKMKLELLKGEGVLFDDRGQLVDGERWWCDFEV
ncbi:hypothetical protein LSUE1_G008447 [Lachnellula suecica]|uniref:Uncharacterized protein n=1 Tax=Lachnellula suecica TaxID=602035 RepID=A0A8T9BUR8_9HELO|nr:hypothetical protein LSUE1_G008447 [Lachnellula suecica]